MRNFLFCIFLSFLPLLSFSQFHTSIDLVSSSDYNKNAAEFLNLEENRNFDYGALLATYNYRFGVNFNARVFDRVMFKAGLRYAKVGFTNQFGEFDREGNPGDLVTAFKTCYQFRFIEIPLVFRFEIGDKKLQFYTEKGISPHLYLNSHQVVTTKWDTKESTFDDDIKRTNIALVFASGANYRLSKSFQMFIQSTIRVFKSNRRIFRGIEMNNRPISYALEVGIRKALAINN